MEVDCVKSDYVDRQHESDRSTQWSFWGRKTRIFFLIKNEFSSTKTKCHLTFVALPQFGMSLFLTACFRWQSICNPTLEQKLVEIFNARACTS